MNKWLSLALNFAPFILIGIPGMPPALIPVIVHGIQEAEQLQGASGADKKAHVLSLVNDGITAVNAAQNKQVINPAVALPAVSAGIDATIGAANTVAQVQNLPQARVK